MRQDRCTILLLVLSGCMSCLSQHNTPLSLPYTCTTTTTLCKEGGNRPDANQSNSRQVKTGRPGKVGPAGQKGERGEKGDPCRCDVAEEKKFLEMRRQLQNMKVEFEEMKTHLDNLSRNAVLPEDCEQYREIVLPFQNQPNMSEVGVYPLKAVGDMTRFVTDCSTESEGTWIVIQRRMDGSVDFYKGWEEYANGFGNTREFWIGLRIMHKLTTTRDYKLRIDLRDWEGNTRYAEYSTFQVGDEASEFPLTVSGYSGSAADALIYHSGQKFSTHDNDNEADSRHCAQQYRGAWWYKGCFHSNLNGLYKHSSGNSGATGISWNRWLGEGYALPFVEMKIKAR